MAGLMSTYEELKSINPEPYKLLLDIKMHRIIDTYRCLVLVRTSRSASSVIDTRLCISDEVFFGDKIFLINNSVTVIMGCTSWDVHPMMYTMGCSLHHSWNIQRNMYNLY